MTARVKQAPANGNGSAVDRGAPASVDALMGLGRTGLRQWSGRIDEEFLKELKNERKYQVYKEMSENDPIVGSVLRAIEFLIRGVDWRVEPADQTDTQQQEMADQIKARLFGMRRSWAEVLVEILSFLPYGWSFHELLYEAKPDGVWWADWPVRAQETLFRWVFVKGADGKDTDVLEAMEQMVPTDSKKRTIPINKGLLFRLGSHKNNPEGISIIRNAYLPWYYKNHLQRIEAIGIERDLAGYPVLYVPGEVLDNPSGAGYVAAQKIVTNIKRDEQEGALLNSGRDAQGNPMWELKLLSTGGTRAFNTNDIINRYDTRIAQTCLADFIVLGQQGRTGSFALADSKTEIFSLALKAILDTICGTVNRDAIPKLAELNGWPTEDLPQLVHGDIELPDLAAVGAYITALSGAGVPLFPDMKLENRLRELGGLPTLSTEEFDTREQTLQQDKQAQQEAQLAVLQQGQQQTDQKATEAGAKADAAMKWLADTRPVLERRDELLKSFGEPKPPIVVPAPNVTIQMAPTTVTAPTPGAQTFNIPAPTVQHSVALAQPIEVQPASPSPVTVTVEAAKAADVKVEAPITVQAAAPVVVPAPIVTVPVAIEAPAAPDITVNVAPADAPIVKVDSPVTVDTTGLGEAVREQTVAQQGLWDRFLKVLQTVLKRPKKLDITLPDGTQAEAKPSDE